MINLDRLDLFNDILDSYLPDTGYDGVLPTSKAYRDNGLTNYIAYLLKGYRNEN